MGGGTKGKIKRKSGFEVESRGEREAEEREERDGVDEGG